MTPKGKGKETLGYQCCRCGNVNKKPDEFMNCCKSAKKGLTHWPIVQVPVASSIKDLAKRDSSDELEQRLTTTAKAASAVTAGGQGKKKGKGKATASKGAPNADDKAMANEIVSAVQRKCDDNIDSKAATKSDDKPKSIEALEHNGVRLTKVICEAAFEICDRNAVKQTVDQDRAVRPPLGSPSDESSETPSDANVRSMTDALRGSGLRSDAEGSSKSNKQAKAPTEAKGLIQRVCPEGGSHRDRLPTHAMPPPVSSLSQGNIAFSNPALTKSHSNLTAVRAARALNLQQIASGQASGDVITSSQYHELRATVVQPDPGYQVLTNHFRVNISPGTKLYEYQVLNIPDTASRSKKSVYIRDMIEVNGDLWSSRADIASDYKRKIISRKPLFDEAAVPGTRVANIAVNNFTAGTANSMPLQLTLGLEFVAVHHLDGLNAFTAGEDEAYKAALATDALNIIIAKAVTDNTNNSHTFQLGTTRFYHRPAWQDLESKAHDTKGLVSVRGYYSSIKPAMDGVLLNINTVNSVFYKAQALADFFGDFRHGKPMSRDVFDGFQKFLSGLRVWLTFKREGPEGQDATIDEPARRTKTLCELGQNPTEQEFQHEGRAFAVWDHIRRKYQQAIKPDDIKLPTGNVGRKGDKGGKYYLAHQLDVLADQPYSRQLSPELTREMIKAARISPDESCKAIFHEGLAALAPAFGQGRDVYLDTRMMSVAARRIPRPSIIYDEGATANADQGYWDMDDRQFVGRARRFDETNDTASVRFFRSTGRFREDNAHCDRYAECFVKANKRYGVQAMQPARMTVKKMTQLDSKNVFGIVKGMIEKHESLAVLLFDKNAHVQRELYATFKIAADQFHGVKSICICEDRILGSRKAKQPGIELDIVEATRDYFRNLAMKVNLRAGNFNHTVSAKDLPKIGSQDCDTIILGADVTHPSPGSIDGTPSIAALVGSVPTAEHSFAHFSGSMRLNTPRKDIIADMEQMATERLREWASVQHHLPGQVLFYRDGVSSSQYAEVKEREVEAIRRAWRQLSKELYNKNPDTEFPKITTVVVTKRHHTRFYPKPSAKSNVTKISSNCAVGTVVDSAITSPYYFDFYLLSHYAPAGTAKPAHYFVLANGIGFTEKELQDLTFKLCFMYCKSTCSVSYCPPAYYADRLCERGRLYLQPFFNSAKDPKKKYGELTPEQVADKAREVFYRGGGRTPGLPANPWHVNHDGIMFWM